MQYSQTNAPKIAVIANSIGVFSPQGKETAEKQMQSLFESLKNQGAIRSDSIFYEERIFAPHEAKKALDIFITAKIDALIVLNSAFPNNNTFLTFAVDPYLWRIPLIITSPPEIDLGTHEWTTNAYCGTIMNNYTAKRIGRHIFCLTGWPQDAAYQNEMCKILRVVYTIKQLRNETIGKFGEAPAGFHSTNGNVLAYAKTFGIRVETVDLLQVVNVYKTGVAEGLEGKSSFSENDVEQTFSKMTAGSELQTDAESVKRAARLYLAMKALIRANGFTSISLRCWPEIMQHLNISACFVLGQLTADGVVTAAGCEGDWPNAVTQAIGCYLSGSPSPCLDFVNDIKSKSIIQTGHCGVGMPAFMENAKISEISPDRQAGNKIGPTCIGQFRFGTKTGISMICDETGKFKMLAFTGESSAQTQQNLLYSAADIKIKNPEQLNSLIFKHGFPHHLAVAFADVADELEMLCEFYGVEFMRVQ
jgi:L-fucose isomerase-like protein